MHKKLTWIWVFLGLGSKLQLVASLSITELFVLVVAPCIFVKNYSQMRRDGVMVFFILSLFVILGCIIGSIVNRTAPEFILRGMAATCIISCSIIVSHWIIRNDPSGFKWYVLTVPLSAILSTFIFKQSVEMSMYGESSEEIMSGPIYWITRLYPLVLAPTKGWYLQTPGVVNVFAPLGIAIYSILTSVSGRSGMLTAVGFSAIVVIGGKARHSMSRISRHFMKICLLGMVLVGLLYFGYKTSAAKGVLGEEARKKYEIQTHGGGIGRLLLGGRGDSFIGLLACRDHPIIGLGPWPRDQNGYTEEFITRFGTIEDVIDFQKNCLSLARNGIVERRLGCHSYITEFWVWYGISGLIFILYTLVVLIRFMKKDVAIVPQWFGWLACSIPGVLWGIFFSPFASRFGFPLFVVACLMARAVRLGKYKLPEKMQMECLKYG